MMAQAKGAVIPSVGGYRSNREMGPLGKLGRHQPIHEIHINVQTSHFPVLIRRVSEPWAEALSSPREGSLQCTVSLFKIAITVTSNNPQMTTAPIIYLPMPLTDPLIFWMPRYRSLSMRGLQPIAGKPFTLARLKSLSIVPANGFIMW